MEWSGGPLGFSVLATYSGCWRLEMDRFRNTADLKVGLGALQTLQAEYPTKTPAWGSEDWF